MIVVDTNVIAYCWINGVHTGSAQRVRLLDPDWHVPILWRSELRSVITGYLRQGSLDADMASAIMAAAEHALAGREHLVPSDAVLALVARTRMSAYDCEFAALAQSLEVALVTQDQEVLKACPELALTMEAFLDRRATPPQAHSARARYRVRAGTRRTATS